MNKPKRGPYKPRIPSPAETPQIHDHISKDDAISFITDNIINEQSERRTTRGKVAKRIRYAIQNGQLSFHGGGIEFGILMAWAREKNGWAEAMSEFPSISGMSFEESLNIDESVDHLTMPGTKEASHEALNKAHQKIAQLKKDLRKAREEIERLRPKAERYDEICEKNRESGGKREMWRFNM